MVSLASHLTSYCRFRGLDTDRNESSMLRAQRAWGSPVIRRKRAAVERRTRRTRGGNGHTRTYPNQPISHGAGPLPRSADTGAMGWVDCDGIDRFNFEQTVWLYPDVQMRATRSLTRAAEVLAMNILSLVLIDREWAELKGKQSERARQLARSFYQDCLSELPNDGWCIPLETVREWLLTQRGDARALKTDQRADVTSIFVGDRFRH